MVVSNWSPGSPHWCAASEIMRIISRAPYVSMTSPEVRPIVCHRPSSTTARMNSFETRTEWFPFWKYTEEYASPLTEPS
jgi:hypothetical protein